MAALSSSYSYGCTRALAPFILCVSSNIESLLLLLSLPVPLDPVSLTISRIEIPPGFLYLWSVVCRGRFFHPRGLHRSPARGRCSQSGWREYVTTLRGAGGCRLSIATGAALTLLPFSLIIPIALNAGGAAGSGVRVSTTATLPAFSVAHAM